jgi:hypothetical protein
MVTKKQQHKYWRQSLTCKALENPTDKDKSMKTQVVCRIICLLLVSGGLLFNQAAHCCPVKIVQNKTVKSKLIVIKVPGKLGMPARRVGEATR